MKVTINLDEDYERAVRKRMDDLQSERVDELRRAGRDGLADEVDESNPDMGDYIAQLVQADLESHGSEP